MKRVTLKDLAKMLNLSTSTVSRALSDHPDISQGTKERVKNIAKELNYTANLYARFFRNNRSSLIALILPEINMFFTPGLIQGINKALKSSNYSFIVFLSNDSYKREKELIDQCISWAAEGVLISLSKNTNNLEHLDRLKQSGISCVLLDKTIESEPFPSVVIDNVAASFEAVSYLIEKGHKNILGIFGSPNLNISQDRLKGYIQALENHHLPVLKENIILADKSDDLDFLLPPILKNRAEISAIFTMSDELLAKCYYHINALDFAIPSDIAVISISDGIYPYLTHPKITHIKNSGSKMGKVASNLLMEIIANPDQKTSIHSYIPTKLVKLGSV